VESSCERGNEPSGSIKCWETIEWLHNLWPLEWNSAPHRQIDSYLVFVTLQSAPVLPARQVELSPPHVGGGSNCCQLCFVIFSLKLLIYL
jgi:hypothetical protein